MSSLLKWVNILSKISSIYAHAIFDIAVEKGQVGEFQSELEGLQRVFSENEQFFELPPQVIKELLVKDLFQKVELEVLHFLELLVDKGRFNHLNEIIRDFHFLANDFFGISEVEIFTAVALDEAQKELLQGIFAKKLNKKIQLVIHLDETLIGGYKARIGDKVYDNSLRTQLKKMRKSLLGKGEVFE